MEKARTLLRVVVGATLVVMTGGCSSSPRQKTALDMRAPLDMQAPFDATARAPADAAMESVRDLSISTVDLAVDTSAQQDAGREVDGDVAGACASCLATSCTSTQAACADTSGCDTLTSCFSACGSGQTCEGSCVFGNSTGMTQAFLLSDCAGRNCPSQCSWGTPLGTCDLCLYSNAPTDMNNCDLDGTCIAWLVCAKQCGSDLDCIQSCTDVNNDIIVEAMVNDFQNVCSGACL